MYNISQVVLHAAELADGNIECFWAKRRSFKSQDVDTTVKKSASVRLALKKVRE